MQKLPSPGRNAGNRAELRPTKCVCLDGQNGLGCVRAAREKQIANPAARNTKLQLINGAFRTSSVKRDLQRYSDAAAHAPKVEHHWITVMAAHIKLQHKPMACVRPGKDGAAATRAVTIKLNKNYRIKPLLDSYRIRERARAVFACQRGRATVCIM